MGDGQGRAVVEDGQDGHLHTRKPCDPECSVKLTECSLKLTECSLKLTELSIKERAVVEDGRDGHLQTRKRCDPECSLKLTECSLKLTECSLKLTECSLKLTECSIKWTEYSPKVDLHLPQSQSLVVPGDGHGHAPRPSAALVRLGHSAAALGVANRTLRCVKQSLLGAGISMFIINIIIIIVITMPRSSEYQKEC
jgi:hypothetical protein